MNGVIMNRGGETSEGKMLRGGRKSKFRFKYVRLHIKMEIWEESNRITKGY